MGISDDYPKGRKSHRSKRDSRSHEILDYSKLDTVLLVDAISGIAKAGGAVRLGLTRDGGAYAIGIYGEGDPYTEYFHDVALANDFLRQIADDYNDSGNRR